jgi:hypothetical protein
MWLRYTKGLVGGKERGPQFEWFAHVVLGKLDKVLPIKVTEFLTERGIPAAKAPKCGETADKSLAPFAESTVLFKRLVDITTLKVGQYMQPLDENLPAIDAFCVSAGVPWEPEAGREPVLLLLQMTVARKHPVVGQTIKDVIDLARKLNLKITDGDIYLVLRGDPSRHNLAVPLDVALCARRDGPQRLPSPQPSMSGCPWSVEQTRRTAGWVDLCHATASRHRVSSLRSIKRSSTVPV